VPSYRLPKPSGQARTIINGHHSYLGKFNSPDSRQKYARLLAETSQPARLFQFRFIHLLCCTRQVAIKTFMRVAFRALNDAAFSGINAMEDDISVRVSILE